MRIKITVKKPRDLYEPLDCSMCGFALRDLEDVLSQKRYKKCTECRTNYSKTITKDN